MIKEGFVLRKMPGMNLVMPAGSNVKTFKGALMLNDTGVVVYEGLKDGKTEAEIAEQLTKEYDVQLEQALADVKKIVENLIEVGIAE